MIFFSASLEGKKRIQKFLSFKLFINQKIYILCIYSICYIFCILVNAMSKNTIKVSSKEKATSIRLTERTKRMLDSIAIGKETHEQIVSRLINICIGTDPSTSISPKGNVIITKYEKANKTISIETGKNTYSVVCTYNDLSIFSTIRNGIGTIPHKQLMAYISNNGVAPEWEADVEIVNMRKANGNWEQPSHLMNKDKKEYLLLYLVSLKHILEDSFHISIPELTSEDDYFDLGNWEKAYKRYGLSMESFHSDVEKKLRVKNS